MPYWWDEDQHQDNSGANEEAETEHSSIHIDELSQGIGRYHQNCSNDAGHIDGWYDVHSIIQAFDVDFANGYSKYQCYNLQQGFVAVQNTQGDIALPCNTNVHIIVKYFIPLL